LQDSHIYINGIGSVAPAGGFSSDSSTFSVDTEIVGCLKIQDPGFKKFIPPDLIRRMGRVVKMGVTAAKLCLDDAGMKSGIEPDLFLPPEAIITGTGWGCLDETEKFLTAMINNHETLLTPTSFIQSTHNTVAGQIALLLQCHGYNFTYVHRGSSFETALLDAIIQIQTGQIANVLVGGTDEVTPGYLSITGRLGMWKRNPIDPMQLAVNEQRGTIPGEGAVFAFLETIKKPESYAVLQDLKILPDPVDLINQSDSLRSFLSEHQLKIQDIDYVLLGVSGDARHDRNYRSLIRLFPETTCFGYFKHLCGEYPTASSFAMAVASRILKYQTVPSVLTLPSGFDDEHLKNMETAAIKGGTSTRKKLDHLLICNDFFGQNHSYILLSKVSV
jgi:3-oxoacyl-(acyl-carrier-protein) synthase